MKKKEITNNHSSIIGLEAFINAHKKHIQNVDVLFAEDVATLFDISFAELLKTVIKNQERFPPDFMFFVKQKENKTEQLVFTMAGILMLSGQLKSEKAMKISVQIIEFIVGRSPNSVFEMITNMNGSDI
ncbi:MAG: ORF6N domain-containing protein [Bacteroidota bacterium]